MFVREVYGPRGIRTLVTGSEGDKIRRAVIERSDLDKFLKLRGIAGISDGWLNDVNTALENYLNYVGWSIDEYKTLEHLKQLQDKYSITSYRKRVYQIRKFLTFLHVEWAKDIKPPAEPYYIPKRVTKCELKNTLSYFEGNRFNKQIKSIILLGSTSGIRPEELYQLDVKDIDLDKRTVYINHNPSNGQSTKTKMSRVSFFSEKAKQALVEYLESFDNNDGVKHPFNKHCISKLFRDSPIQVKDLRKYFSQVWDKRGGPTSIKKILMGHSMKGDIDLMHYNYQSEEDLKKIYNRIMDRD